MRAGVLTILPWTMKMLQLDTSSRYVSVLASRYTTSANPRSCPCTAVKSQLLTCLVHLAEGDSPGRQVVCIALRHITHLFGPDLEMQTKMPLLEASTIRTAL